MIISEIGIIDIIDKKLKRYIIDMGITRGAIVKIKKKSPFGDVLDIEVRDYELCLRKSDLKNIFVEVLI